MKAASELSSACARAFFVLSLIGASFASPGHAQTEINVRNVDIRAFVEIVAEATGRGYTLDEQVRGTVTVVAPEPLGRDAIYEIFLDVLELNRLTLIEGAQTDRIVPAAQARELSPSGTSRNVGGFETRIITLQSLPVADAVEVIRPLVAQEAVLSTLPRSRQIILTDRVENINKISRLLIRLDQREVSEFETIRLRFGQASDIVAAIEALDILPSGTKISAETGSNAIVVSGSSEARGQAQRLVRQLDSPKRSTASHVVRLKYARAPKLAEVITRSFGGRTDPDAPAALFSVEPDEDSNSLVITAPTDQMDAILRTIASLDEEPDQVLVEAVIFELSVESFSDLSAQFGVLLDDAVLGLAQFSLGGRPTLSGLVNAAMQGTPLSVGQGGSLGVNAINQAGDRGFLAFLTALAQDSSTRLLSTPSIMTLDNVEAEIVVAQNVPFVTGSFATVGDSAVPDQPFQTISRQDIGLTLRITPQIATSDKVRMQVVQEVSNLTSTASAAGGEITSKRALRTSVLVGDGRVIMLGGLLENGSGSVDAGVPGLRDLKFIGGLFRGRSVNKSQRVLLMLLRPRIMDDAFEAETATRQAAQDARAVSARISAKPDKRYPARPDDVFPFDGQNLDQPFGAGLVDRISIERQFPLLPPEIGFTNGND